MAAMQYKQLNDLCSSSDTLEKAKSILCLVNAKTRPGSGFVVKKTLAIPPICAYLASEQLNAGEVSLHSAMCAACITQTEFSDILKTVRAALRTDEANVSMNVTYEKLVDTYHVRPREDMIGCMQDAEAALSHVNILKERYGANILSCAIFYWVCQLTEEPSVQERALCQTYSINPKSFKAVVKILDKQCDTIADQIKSYLLQRRSSAQAPQMTVKKSSTPAITPSRKRTVAFAHLSSDGDLANDDGTSFPETPTKKRRIDSSPRKPRTSRSPAKRPSAASTAAFHAALQGSPTKQSIRQENESLGAGPSTPRRPRHAKVADVTATPVQADSQPSPFRSQGQALPTRPPVRRFRPIFLEQQQWCARDPKVDRMWAVADGVLGEMVKAHGHPFQRSRKRGGAIIGAA